MWSASSSSSWRKTRSVVSIVGLLLILALLFRVTRIEWAGSEDLPTTTSSQGRLLHLAQPTLIIYILSLADTVYLENFYFFYYEAILRDSSAQYDILVPKQHYQDSLLPPLPAHARYVIHDVCCPGLSLVRWHLREQRRRRGTPTASQHAADPTATTDASTSNAGSSPSLTPDADRVVLLSSAVRGPFIPPGLRPLVTWHVALAAAGGGSSSSSSRAGRRAGPDIAAGVISCVQPPGGRGGAGGGTLPPFPEFTAISASKAAIEVLLGLQSEHLPECVPAAAAAAAWPAESPAAGSLTGTDARGAGTRPRPGAVPGPSGPPGPPACEPAAVLAADCLTAAQSAARAALVAWSSSALAGRPLTLGSLAVRQRGVDWADPRSWGCNGGVSPLAEHSNDGLTLAPYEAMFVPLSTWDEPEAPYGTPAEYGRVYADWMQAAAAEAGELLPPRHATLADTSATRAAATASDDAGADTQAPQAAHDSDGSGSSGADRNRTGVSSPLNRFPAPAPRLALVSRNRYSEPGSSAAYQLPAVLFAVALGQQCFDEEHFRQANPDLGPMPGSEAWKFWVFVGQFQPRAFRLRCGMDWRQFGLRGAAGGRRGGGRGRQ